jgi:hypothetical protein
MRQDELAETTKEVSHLPHVSSPKLMPLMMIKNMETIAITEDMMYAMILYHQGKVKLFLILTVLSAILASSSLTIFGLFKQSYIYYSIYLSIN